MASIQPSWISTASARMSREALSSLGKMGMTWVRSLTMVTSPLANPVSVS